MATSATAAGAKGKTQARSVSDIRGRDWQYCSLYQQGIKIPKREEVVLITLLFKLRLEEEDIIPGEYTKGLQFLDSLTSQAVWTGYWATYIGEQIAISNTFGVWFEIERTPHGHWAVRLAHPEL